MEHNHSQYNQYHHSPYHHTPFSVFDNTTIFSFNFLTLTFSIGMEEQGWICGTRLAEYSVLMLDLSTIVCHVLNHSKPYQRYSRSYTIMPQLHRTISCNTVLCNLSIQRCSFSQWDLCRYSVQAL